MKALTEREVLLVNTLVENFYKVVPLKLMTYCSLTSRISQTTLKHFGIETELLPCQVWVVTPEENFIVGFLGNPSNPAKWDGHVVCGGDNFIIDAALHHFNVEFGLTVPPIVATPKFLVPTQVVSRLKLNTTNYLWWHLPPISEEIDLSIPQEPPELISAYSRQLIERLATAGVGIPDHSATGDAPTTPKTLST